MLRRLGISALILLGALYLKLCMPSEAGGLVSSLHGMLDVQQAEVYLPPEWTGWIISD